MRKILGSYAGVKREPTGGTALLLPILSQNPLLTYIFSETYSLTVIKIIFTFSTRKIQKVRYSYLVPLPVQWVKNMKLHKGDSLRIEMQEDYSLRITTVPQARQDSEGTESVTPSQLKEEVLSWKL